MIGGNIMKRIIALLVTFAFVFLCGCTGETNEKETTASTTTALPEQSKTTESLTIINSGVPYTVSDTEQEKKLFYSKEIKADPADPYSSFIKKRCEEESLGWESRAKREGNTTKNFYYYLTSHEDFYYCLYDLDKDGKDELLLGGFKNVGEYSVIPTTPQKKIVITNICAVKNGEVVKLDKYGLFMNLEYIRDCYLLSNGKIVTTWGYKDSPNYFIVDYEKNELVSKCYIERDEDDSFINLVDFEPFRSVPITNEQYKSIYNELCGDAKKVDIDWKRIDEYGM